MDGCPARPVRSKCRLWISGRPVTETRRSLRTCGALPSSSICAATAALPFMSALGRSLHDASAFGFCPRAPLPVISIASDDAAFLRRLLAKRAVKIRLDVQNSFPGPGTERNVVADLPGVDSKEMVLLTAHFDDWDPAQGANDNGTGVAAGAEAASS